MQGRQARLYDHHAVSFAAIFCKSEWNSGLWNQKSTTWIQKVEHLKKNYIDPLKFKKSVHKKLVHIGLLFEMLKVGFRTKFISAVHNRYREGLPIKRNYIFQRLYNYLFFKKLIRDEMLNGLGGLRDWLDKIS